MPGWARCLDFLKDCLATPNCTSDLSAGHMNLFVRLVEWVFDDGDLCPPIADSEVHVVRSVADSRGGESRTYAGESDNSDDEQIDRAHSCSLRSSDARSRRIMSPRRRDAEPICRKTLGLSAQSGSLR